MSNKRIWVVSIVVFMGGLMTGSFLSTDSPDTKQGEAQTLERKVKYWVAPMDSNYRRDKPGKSPMGMDLVPVYEEDTLSEDVITISPHVENNLGVKVAKIKRTNTSKTIETVGYATVDENQIEQVNTYVDGWIRNLAVKTTGEKVEKGQLLFELFSPKLVQAQEEYVLAINSNNQDLMQASEQKLKTLGISANQIKALKQTKKVQDVIQYFANQQGIVSNLSVREGMFIKPDTPIMTIEDLSSIWVIAEVFERHANLLEIGAHAVATFPYLPNKEWIGKIDYIYPSLDKKNHTVRVRITFPNMDVLIKPNMYADVTIHTQPLKQVLVVPASAVIRTSQGDRVILALGDGAYRPVPIQVGYQSEDVFIVLYGLKEGDRVVTSAQFLIDSESNMTASLTRLHQDTSHEIDLKEYQAMGVIKKINKQKHSLTLDHEAIPAIEMPAMNMEIQVDKQLDISHLSEGTSIHFIFVLKGEELLITKIHPQ